MDWTDDASETHVPSVVEDPARPVVADDEEEVDLVDRVPIDLPIEAPEADVLDQLRDVPLEDDHDR